MEGIIINHENNRVAASLEHGVFCVIITILPDNMQISYVGLNSSDYVTWYDSRLKKGDRIVIKIADIEENSKLIDVCPRNREEMLQEYFRLKSQLKNEGLI